MSTLRDAARRRLELNPITTSMNHGHLQSHHLQTPSSALSNNSNSLSAPFGYNPSTFTPVSDARQYNPQQWTASPSIASEHGSQFTTHRQQDPEGSVSFLSCIYYDTKQLSEGTNNMSSNCSCTASIFSTSKQSNVYDH